MVFYSGRRRLAGWLARCSYDNTVFFFCDAVRGGGRARGARCARCARDEVREMRVIFILVLCFFVYGVPPPSPSRIAIAADAREFLPCVRVCVCVRVHLSRVTLSAQSSRFYRIESYGGGGTRGKLGLT